jgi:hypothetical protein
MGLFSRKKSSANDSSPRTERVPATPAVAKPNNDYGGTSTMLRLELSPEVSTPLYERFTHANEQGAGHNSRLSLGLFDGSSMGFNGRAAASPKFEAQAAASGGRRDPLDDTPPSAFRGLSVSTPSPPRKRSVELSAAPGPKLQAQQQQQQFYGPGVATGPNNDYSITLIQPNTAREQENLAMTALLARRASQSLDLPRESSAPPPSRSSASPKLREQQKPHQSVRQQRSRTLEGSSARNSTIPTAMPPVITTPESAHPSRPSSSSGHRMSTAAVSILPPSQLFPSVPPPPTQSSIKNTSVDISFYPSVVQPMYNDSYNAHSGQPISQQQQQQHEPQARPPHRFKTTDTPPATLSADASPRKHKSSLRSAISTPTPTDVQYEETPPEHRSRRASASFQPSVVTLPTSSRAHAQAQEHVHAQRPTLPSSPPVSGLNADALSSSGTGASAVHMLRRRSRSIISTAVGTGGSGSPYGGSPEKEKARGSGGVSRFPSPSKPGTPTQPAYNLRESRVLGPSAPSTSTLRDRGVAQATQTVDSRIRTTSEKAPGGLGWSAQGDDVALPSLSTATRAHPSPSPKVSPNHMYSNGDTHMVAAMLPASPKKGAIEPGVGAVMRRRSVNNSSNGYIHHPPQTTYMYYTQPPHVPGPVPPTSFPYSAAAQLQLNRNEVQASSPARGDSSASSRATVVSALSSSTVRSPVPSSHTSVSNDLSARPQQMTAATDVSPMSLDPHAHQKMMKEQARQKRRQHRKLHKMNVATPEPESAGVPAPSSVIISRAPAPGVLESDDPTTPTAVQQAGPQADTVHILRMSRKGEERLSDVMRADDDPFARVVSPVPGSHAGGDDDVTCPSLDDVIVSTESSIIRSSRQPTHLVAEYFRTISFSLRRLHCRHNAHHHLSHCRLLIPM